MFQLPGGWEIIVIIVIIAVIFGGPKIMNSMKAAAKDAYKVKKEIDDIKHDITGKK